MTVCQDCGPGGLCPRCESDNEAWEGRVCQTCGVSDTCPPITHGEYGTSGVTWMAGSDNPVGSMTWETFARLVDDARKKGLI